MSNAFQTLDAEARRLLGMGLKDLSREEQRVIEKLVRRSAIARNLAEDDAQTAPFGERLADQVAAVGGSWGFIIVFGLILVGWMALNGWALSAVGVKPFDPYPYIFLNLMLSTVAALQAPVIMMSQNRQSAKDREAAAHDYEVNLKAELEIMSLHEKLDALRAKEMADLLSQQLTLLQELRDRGATGA